jgi:hypothetical protein
MVKKHHPRRLEARKGLIGELPRDVKASALRLKPRQRVPRVTLDGRVPARRLRFGPTGHRSGSTCGSGVDRSLGAEALAKALSRHDRRPESRAADA